MPGCTVCGDCARLSFVCKLCGEANCSEHQLPENHGCFGLEVYDRDESWFHTEEAIVEAGTAEASRYRQEAPVAIEKGDLGHLPGTRPDPEYNTSPDVAADGSVISPTESAASESPGSTNLGRRLWWVSAHVERYRTRPSSVLVDIAYIGAVCGIVAAVYFAVTRFLL